MRHSSITNYNRTSSKGFTLVEILVIAPIVMLALGGFIALMVTMVGDVLATRDQSAMTYESQDTLSTVENDIKLSVQYLTTTGALSSPQGNNSSGNGTTAFTNTTTINGASGTSLILNTLATDSKPESATRQIVYYKNQPYDCTTQRIYNSVFLVKQIYFIKNGSLWRRTVMPIYNTSASVDSETLCAVPWQKNSCSPGQTAARCDTNDVELMKNVASMSVEYFLTPDSFSNIGAANAAQATTVKVTINGSKSVAGRSVSSSQSTRATRINAAIKPPLQETLRFTTQPFSQTVVQNESNVQFTAQPSLNRATIQWQRSTNGGSTWSNISGATSATYNAGTATLAMNNYRYRAVATTPEGSATSNVAVLTVNLWGNLDLEQDWETYGTPTWHDGGYTKTNAGVVVLKGMLRKTSPQLAGEKIATLPVGYRPKGTLLYGVATYSNASGRLDILANGDIIAHTIDGTWVSFDNIRFIPADTNYTFTPLVLQNTWANYGGSYAPAEYVYDSLGRVHTQGLVRYGTVTNDSPIAVPSNTAHRSPQYLHFPTRDNGGFTHLGSNSAGTLAKTGLTNGYVSLSTMYDTSITSGWINIPLINGWTAHSTTYSSPQYTKDADGLVNLKGLIKDSAVPGYDSIIAILPAGYCPAKRMLFPTVSVGAFASFDVVPQAAPETGCELKFVTGSQASYAIDSISYIAEK